MDVGILLFKVLIVTVILKGWTQVLTQSPSGCTVG